MNTPDTKVAAPPVSNVRQRVMAIVLTVMDELPDMVQQTEFDKYTKGLIVTLVKIQLPKIIMSAINKVPDEEIVKQVKHIRDEVIPIILGETDSHENSAQH